MRPINKIYESFLKSTTVYTPTGWSAPTYKDFQEDFVEHFEQFNNLLVYQSRQLGVTTLSLYCLFYKALTTPNVTVVYAAPRQIDLNVANEKITGFVKGAGIEVYSQNKYSIEFPNGSRFKFVNVNNADAFRGYRIDYIFLDLFNTVSRKSDVLTVLHCTLSPSAKTILSFFGGGTSYPEIKSLVDGAISGENQYRFLHMPWYVDKTKTSDWRRHLTIELGKDHSAEEIDVKL